MQSGYLRFENISKQFPGVKALDGVTFEADEGSVHALVGENGAGKSTLLKILSGLYRPDGGHISLGGVAQHFSNTSDALHAGVAIIYQELNLVPDMTVAENLFLGHMPAKMGWLGKKALRENTLEMLKTLEEAIDPDCKIGNLSIAERQMIEIAKALARKAKVIAFDEPTSSLSDREVQKLFAIIAELKRQGKVILYVSHRLSEIFAICNAVTVFRDGKHIETFTDMSKLTQDQLVTKMVGRSIHDVYHYVRHPHGEAALEVENLMGYGLAEPATLTVNQGEVVGIFGLVGAGRTELLKLIYGATKAKMGKIKVFGREVRITKPSHAIHHGIVFCPEDRKKEGIIPIRSVRENINISVRRLTAKMGFIPEKRDIENAEHFVEQFNIKTPSIDKLVRDLSGGNQQKVVLARWLSEKVKVVLFDEPTRGIDVGAKAEIYGIISKLAAEGIGVLIVSSELPEILGISDRIIVMRQGKLQASLTHDEATEEKVLRLALPVVENKTSIYRMQ
ncbi:L-arabinose transport system ATP-binding protein [Hydrogenispora ethanolica]|uniref:L-arabinose transport system ATP-binding protein n=1 Tax=Hydrogenispora ethanolica TaxID=1082276 RepID=A0A4R1R8W4_HYDET|nr:L-arabinose ABC transporter ATP-binding protein AraG [Hydrogenispora ethanolica]TCL62000.1 L-arabinose transport system ATP-binding protein [Hydrogenispora ethanolica]